MPKLITTNMSINNGDVLRRYKDFGDYCLEARPDIIAVQEVSADNGKVALEALAKLLGKSYEFIYGEVYPGQDTQGVGVLTRFEVQNSQIFDSGHGRNKFQILDLLTDNDRQLMLANVHMEAHLMLDIKRLRKLGSLISQLNPASPHILVGDFNAFPRLPSMRYLSRRYTSAHLAIHGKEPSHTYPTDLGEDLLLNHGDASRRQILLMKLGALLFQNENRLPSGLPRMVTDYVFVNPLVQVHGVKVTGHNEASLAHSDHLGLEVDFRY